MNFFKRIYLSSVDFSSYKDVLSGKSLRPFLFFLFSVIFFSFILYPPFYSRQMSIMNELFTFYADRIPALEFSSFKLSKDQNEQAVIRNETLSLVVDPQNSFDADLSLGPWLHLTSDSLRFSVGNQRGAVLAYDNPVVKQMLLLFDDLNNDGNGVIKGDYFTDLFSFIKRKYFLPGIAFFIINVFISCFLSSLLVSFFMYLYGRLIKMNISWKIIRSLSYYALSPVFILLVLLFYLNISTEQLSPLIIIFYFLFFRGALVKNINFSPEE